MFFFLRIRRPPRFTLFPYPPLFRSAAVSMSWLLASEYAPFERAKGMRLPPRIATGRAVVFMGPPAGGRSLVRGGAGASDRKSTRLNSSHANISYAVFCLKKKK